jgi:hypothetical protein
MRARTRHAGERGIGGREDGDSRRAHRRGEMREAGIDADHDLRIACECGKFRQRLPRWHDDILRTCRQSSAAFLFGFAAPGNKGREPRLRKVRQQRTPAILGPQLVAAAGRVEHQRIRRRGHACHSGRRRELPAWRSFDPVSQCRGGERATLVDEVLVARDPVMDVVEPRRHRLADAAPIEAMAAPARHARHEGALHLFLHVQHDRVVIVAQCPPEGTEFAPGLRCERRIAPAPKRHRHHGADARVEPYQRDEGFLGDPVDRHRGIVRGDVADQGERVDDIAERRRADDEQAAHPPAPRIAAVRAGIQTT